MKILFLDFDGVLNDNALLERVHEDYQSRGVRLDPHDTGRCLKHLDPVRCARVQRIHEATGAALVLVTGWRRWHAHEVLTGFLRHHGLTAPVLHTVGGVKMSGDLRASASRDWLKEHREVTRHVVLDDDVDSWTAPWHRPWAGKLIHPVDGVEDSHVAEAIAYLNEDVPQMA